MTRFRYILRALLCLALVSGSARAAEPTPAKIKEVRRLDDTIARLGGIGDNWCSTWTSDDRVLAGLCDGSGFPWPKVTHRSYNSHLITVDGAPPKLEFSETPGYPEL